MGQPHREREGKKGKPREVLTRHFWAWRPRMNRHDDVGMASKEGKNWFKGDEHTYGKRTFFTENRWPDGRRRCACRPAAGEMQGSKIVEEKGQ